MNLMNPDKTNKLIFGGKKLTESRGDTLFELFIHQYAQTEGVKLLKETKESKNARRANTHRR